MLRSNHSCTERKVDPLEVAKEGNEDSLEDETEVENLVLHTLLGDGQVSSLADHEIGPLDTNDRHEVGALSGSESFSGVAHVNTADRGLSEELGGVDESAL